MYGFKTLEKKYGITVGLDSIRFTADRGKVMRYKIYSADGCPWENGLTRAGVKAECEEWAEQLLAIKRQVELEKGEQNEKH